MKAIVKGQVMNDFIKETEFEGLKKSTRIIYLYQLDDDSKELLEIKDTPEDFKVEIGKVITIPVSIRHWRNPKGQSGLSVKYSI